MNSLTTSAACRRSRRSRIGMPNLSRCVRDCDRTATVSYTRTGTHSLPHHLRFPRHSCGLDGEPNGRHLPPRVDPESLSGRFRGPLRPAQLREHGRERKREQGQAANTNGEEVRRATSLSLSGFSLCVPAHVCRYYAKTGNINWPPEVHDYNKRFTKTLDAIKRRHDPTVTTTAQGVLEWKRRQNARNIGLDIQAWLDRFYLSRIGIRFLIGQRQSSALPFLSHDLKPLLQMSL